MIETVTCLGSVHVPAPMLAAAELIKLQNYKTNTPKRFQVQPLHEEAAGDLLTQLAGLCETKIEELDFVYFSVCKGAEPHVDLLDPDKFHSKTLVIPIILPTGVSTLTVLDKSYPVELNKVYLFNHELMHSMELEDVESGCVVIMVAVKKATA